MIDQHPAPVTKKQRLDNNTTNMCINGAFAASNTTNNLPPGVYGNNCNNFNVRRSNKTMNSRSRSTISSGQTPKKGHTKKNTIKIQNGIEFLKKFKKEHDGQLCSKRMMMKKLSIGFPKANQTLDAYCKQIGQKV